LPKITPGKAQTAARLNTWRGFATQLGVIFGNLFVANF